MLVSFVASHRNRDLALLEQLLAEALASEDEEDEGDADADLETEFDEPLVLSSLARRSS